MKNLVSKVLPLVNKFKGKKPIVIILSVVAIVAGVFAVKKGYIAEESLNFETIIDFISNSFIDAPVVDSVVAPVDNVNIEVVDSVVNQ